MGQLFPLLLKHLQEIQVEMLRRQVNMWALRRKLVLSLNVYIRRGPSRTLILEEADCKRRHQSDYSQEIGQNHQKTSLMLKLWLYYLDLGSSTCCLELLYNQPIPMDKPWTNKDLFKLIQCSSWWSSVALPL